GEHDAADRLRQLAANLHRNVAPFGKRLRHLLPSGAELDDREIAAIAKLPRQLTHALCDEDAEDRLELLGRVEIAGPSERIARAAVIAEFRMVQRLIHELVKTDRTVLADSRRQQLSEFRHGPMLA